MKNIVTGNGNHSRTGSITCHEGYPLHHDFLLHLKMKVRVVPQTSSLCFLFPFHFPPSPPPINRIPLDYYIISFVISERQLCLLNGKSCVF